MTDYGYKVRLINADCGTVRLTAFHDEDFLTYHQIAEEAPLHLSSQTCPRCSTNHPDDSYVACDIQRGEPDIYGATVWRSVYPEAWDTAVQGELDYE